MALSRQMKLATDEIQEESPRKRRCIAEEENRLAEIEIVDHVRRGPPVTHQEILRKSGGTQLRDTPKPLLVTKWVDYSNKYGFGAQLSDGSVTVRFNDCSKIALSPGKSTVHYCDQVNNACQCRSSAVPTNLQAKFMLLTYFANYMDKHLLKGGDSKVTTSADQPSFPFVDIWFRTDITMVMYLSNGTMQVNFFNDHTKIVLIPGASDILLIYIDKQREGTSYLMSDISSQGCAPEMVERLRYCRRVLKKVWDLVEEESNC
ncbi:hypothetical protein OS493_025097 [Desmophyllum pertusum]|uniref:POLO box domain-containing protein n=1 Tax=Desmophyllum pertusum TaxID=174260 RepID=A0A9W9YDJ2_9CNID|nr:hypothetical protein OS493_025097 [Desmophyllum pertusum]